QCNVSHVCNKHSARFELPTRLLYVGNPDVLSLYCPKEGDRMQYVALSHCWGEDPPTKNNPQFCTTDDNIERRLKGFSFSELPKTFRDAVHVTRELGFQYLWIDSLCIVQWNQEDWKYEAKRMESVFASAYCTIAAASAVDSEAGFLERNIRSEYVFAQDASGRRFYICADTDNSGEQVDVDDFDDHVGKARLNTRAWALQERVLSQRTIHFSDKGVYWECSNGVYCETLTKLESFLGKQSFMFDSDFPGRLFESGNRRAIEFIHFLFEDYSKRGMTKETDRCVAISGLEARIARARRCESRYGILQSYLHRNLLWQRVNDKKTERIGYKPEIVPAWSWMAYGGGIQFMEIPFGRVGWNDGLRFSEEHKHVLLTDIGVFRNCRLEPSGGSYAVLDSSEAERGRIRYDTKASEGLDAERCVVVGRELDENELGAGHKKNYILVVRPTSVDDEYMRVGSGWIQSDYIRRQRLNVRVV
ncbi:heterokaryon incompatibility protein-domain-containing protein, partial [Lineolata rhizophorae]